MLQSCTTESLDWMLGSISIQRVVKYWNRLPREVVDALSLPVFNRHLDNPLYNMTFGQP